jgi:hypothetical protein
VFRAAVWYVLSVSLWHNPKYLSMCCQSHCGTTQNTSVCAVSLTVAQSKRPQYVLSVSLCHNPKDLSMCCQSHCVTIQKPLCAVSLTVSQSKNLFVLSVSLCHNPKTSLCCQSHCVTTQKTSVKSLRALLSNYWDSTSERPFDVSAHICRQTLPLRCIIRFYVIELRTHARTHALTHARKPEPYCE